MLRGNPPIKNVRAKGMRSERQIVAMHIRAGVPASKVPLSGSVGGEFSGDVRVGVGDKQLLAEVKARSKGQQFVMINKWLANNDLLFCKADHRDPIVVMPQKTYLKLIKAYLDCD